MKKVLSFKNEYVNKKFNWLAIVLIILGISIRLLPHPPNFTPIGAMALFSGAYFTNKKLSFLIPLAAMFCADIFLGFAEIWVTLSIYGSFIIISLIGRWLKNNYNFVNIFGASIISSSIFFVVTNFVVWLATPWYTKNVAGLVECFFLALPFFRNTIMGDLFYVAVFFGVYVLASNFVKKRQINFLKIKF